MLYIPYEIINNSKSNSELFNNNFCFANMSDNTKYKIYCNSTS